MTDPGYDQRRQGWEETRTLPLQGTVSGTVALSNWLVLHVKTKPLPARDSAILLGKDVR